MQLTAVPGGHKAVVCKCLSEYFNDTLSDDDRRAVLVSDLVRVLLTAEGRALLDGVLRPVDDQLCAAHVDYAALHAAVGGDDIAEALLYEPADALLCIAAATHSVRNPAAARVCHSYSHE